MQTDVDEPRAQSRELVQVTAIDGEGLATLRQLYPKLRAGSDEESIFLMTCNRTLLSPFARQIYPVWRRVKENDQWVEKMQVQVSIDGFRIQAERSHKYDSQVGPFWCGPDGKWMDVWLSEKPPAAAKVGVWRKGAREPIWGIATYREYVQKTNQGDPNRMWKGMPANMLAKCAEALALRRALPYELSGLYTEDEMGQADNVTGPILDHRQGDDTLRKMGEEATYRMGPEAAASDSSTSTEAPKEEAPPERNGKLYPLGDGARVDSTDDLDYRRFEEIREAALGVNLKVSPVRLPYARAQFVKMYDSLLGAVNMKRREEGLEPFYPKDPHALPAVIDANVPAAETPEGEEPVDPPLVDDDDEGDVEPEPATDEQLSLIKRMFERKGIAEVELDGRTYSLDTIVESDLPKMTATQIIALLNQLTDVPEGEDTGA